MSSYKGHICLAANPLYGEDVGYYNNGNYVDQFGLSDLFTGEDASCIASVPVVQRSEVLKSEMAESLKNSKGGTAEQWLQVIAAFWSVSSFDDGRRYRRKSSGSGSGSASGFTLDSVIEYCKSNPLVAIGVGFIVYKLAKKVLR